VPHAGDMNMCASSLQISTSAPLRTEDMADGLYRPRAPHAAEASWHVLMGEDCPGQCRLNDNTSTSLLRRGLHLRATVDTCQL
jgi:hypothetical protein